MRECPHSLTQIFQLPHVKKSNSRLVYSTDQGRIKEDAPSTPLEKGDGIIRIRRETKGRNGKGVTCIQGFDLNEKELKALAKQLKQTCGTGGSVKGREIEIQGDKRKLIKSHLEKKGFQVKLSGG